MKGKKKSPSRVRYDAGHPTVSFRLSLELKERLEQYIIGEEQDQSAWQEGYYEGYEYGEEVQEERIEEIERKLDRAREKIGEREAYIKTIAGANQGFSRRNQELEAQVALLQKQFSNMTHDELCYMTRTIEQAHVILLKRQYGWY